MDSFLIARLERLMQRSPVSPYAVARFFIVGAGLAVFVTQVTWLDQDMTAVSCAVSAVFTVWMLWNLARDYRLTTAAELENNSGFLNSLKVRRSGWRVWIAFFLVAFIALLAWFPNLNNVAWTTLAGLQLAYGYFQALNWTPPPVARSSSWLQEMAGRAAS